MSRYVLKLEEIDRTQVSIAGGKGASLGELTRIEGIRVPAGFCITTEAFDRVLAAAPSIGGLRDRLSLVGAEDFNAVRALSAEIRRAIEEVPLQSELTSEIEESLTRLGDAQAAYAVRSSATAEDLPSASFAGQQDTYLNVVGTAAILAQVSRCWASLFTERALIYRKRNGFDHRKVRMAVIVQRMVFAEAAGVLFTADPITSSRKIASVEATFGLGEALVSGRVNPDVYRVRDGAIVMRKVAAEPPLTDAEVVELVRLGRTIEAHFGRPQDIEWCLADGAFQIVQSRAITTLFPIPTAGDDGKHVYVSVGHQQMMTDAMKPLGLSLWQLTTPRAMLIAGGRLFVDVTPILAAPASRAAFLGLLGRAEPLMQDALQTLLDRGDIIASVPDPAPAGVPVGSAPEPIATDRAIVLELIARNRASVAALQRDIQSKSGAALLDFILDDLKELKRLLFDRRSHHLIMAGMEATWWLRDQLDAWLGEKNAADVLTQSVSDNVTSKMGLALLDVADVIRPYPAVIAFLENVRRNDGFLDEIEEVEGGAEARAAIRDYLDVYGMRCVGEIDVTRPRWAEHPTALVPMILGNVRSFEPGAGARRFAEGREEARKKEEEVLARVRALPDGEQKAEETKRMIDRVRTLSGYREYPKYGMICRYFVYKCALLAEAGRLVQAGVLSAKDDVFYLTFAELHDVVRTQANKAPLALIQARRDEFRLDEALTPPRVLTSDGECLSGSYRRTDLPPGALVGLPVSAGTIEGRARVIHDVAEARVEAGDILVTAFTDPSWTPLFVAIKGLVTEVGGLMTHGAVIAREYGLPAVVGVAEATRRIRDGQRIRVDGTDGYVEILS